MTTTVEEITSAIGDTLHQHIGEKVCEKTINNVAKSILGYLMRTAIFTLSLFALCSCITNEKKAPEPDSVDAIESIIAREIKSITL